MQWPQSPHLETSQMLRHYLQSKMPSSILVCSCGAICTRNATRPWSPFLYYVETPNPAQKLSHLSWFFCCCCFNRFMTIVNSVFDEGDMAVVICSLWGNDLSWWGTTFWLVVTGIAPFIWKLQSYSFLPTQNKPSEHSRPSSHPYFLTAIDPIKKRAIKCPEQNFFELFSLIQWFLIFKDLTM